MTFFHYYTGTYYHLSRENKLLTSLTLDEIWPDYVL